MVIVRTFEWQRDPASQLLNAWSTDYVTLRQLVDCLQSAGLLREASLIRALLHVPPATGHSPHHVPPASASAVPDSHAGLHVPFTELSKWTRNFNEVPAHTGGCLLGQGGYADVFKGSKSCHSSNSLVNVVRLVLQPLLQSDTDFA